MERGDGVSLPSQREPNHEEKPPVFLVLLSGRGLPFVRRTVNNPRMEGRMLVAGAAVITAIGALCTYYGSIAPFGPVLIAAGCITAFCVAWRETQ